MSMCLRERVQLNIVAQMNEKSSICTSNMDVSRKIAIQLKTVPHGPHVSKAEKGVCIHVYESSATHLSTILESSSSTRQDSIQKYELVNLWMFGSRTRHYTTKRRLLKPQATQPKFAFATFGLMSLLKCLNSTTYVFHRFCFWNC